MREKWARRIAVFTGLLVLLLAITFAIIQNPSETSTPVESRKQLAFTEPLEPISLDAEAIEAGQQIYKQQHCARCHSIAGKGNPRNPLDGVGAKRSAEELHDWITGADALQEELPGYALRMKQVYRELPADDLDALVIYMQSLRL